VEEIPLRVRTNPLLGSFLSTLVQPSSSSSHLTPSDSLTLSASDSTTLPPSFASLDLASASLTRNLSHVIDALDEYKTEEGNLAYNLRQIAREKARADAYVAKRKEENALRVSQGLAPLPEDDVSRLFKIPPEPSRLESMLLLGKIDAYSKSLAEGSSIGLVKMYTTNAGESS
jgi:translation initiation factor 3 subunit H